MITATLTTPQLKLSLNYTLPKLHSTAPRSVGRLHSNDRNWGVFCRSSVPSPSLTAQSRRLVARPLPRKHLPEQKTTAQLLLLAALQTKLKHHCSPFMLTSLMKKRSSRTQCSHTSCLTFSLVRTAANRSDFTVLFYNAVLFRRTRAKAVSNFLVVGSLPASSRRVGTRAGSSGWRLVKRTRPASRQSTASSLFCLCLFSAAPLVRCACCRSPVGWFASTEPSRTTASQQVVVEVSSHCPWFLWT